MYDDDTQETNGNQGRTHGGGAELPSRVIAALQRCEETIGALPTARKYGDWRQSLPPEERMGVPSLTSVVPIAFPTWREARSAAGIEVGTTASHGPQPTWSEEQCWAVVVQWLDQERPPYTFAKYNAWVHDRRAAGDAMPSVSTVRLRLRLPWSGIIDGAAQRAGVTVDTV